MFIRVNPVTKDIEVVFNAQVAAQLRLESAQILFFELGAAIAEVEEGEDPAESAVEPVITGDEPPPEPDLEPLTQTPDD